MEFRKILNEYGNRMDQLELLESGDEKLGITAIDTDFDTYYINKFKGKFYKTDVYSQDGMYIENTWEVEPVEKTITAYIRVKNNQTKPVSKKPKW